MNSLSLLTKPENRKIFRYLFFFSIVLGSFLFARGASAATYYVDCNAANDNGAGTAEGTAWKTINKVNNSSFSGDDQILFLRGCVWREQLTAPSSGNTGHPITFGAYGDSGNPKPTINGSDIVSSWTADISSYSETFNMDNWGCWGNYSTSQTTAGRTYRTEFLQSAVSGASIRITVKGGASDAVIEGSSIGVSDGTYDRNYAATPTKITWDGGNNGTTVAAGATKVSDPITFAWNTANKNLISIYVSSGTLVRYDSTVPGYNYLFLNDSDVNTVMDINLGGTGDLINDSAILKVEVSSGLANVWNATVSATPKQVFNNDVLAAKGASKAALTEGKWFASGTTLSYYESAGNPGSQGYSLEASTRDYGIYFNAQDKVTVDNFIVTKANKYGINIGHDTSHTLDNAIVQNSLVQYSYDAGIFSWVPTSLAGPWGVQILNNETSYNGLQANTDGTSPAPVGIEILGSNAIYGTLVQGNNIHHNAWGMELDQGSENTTVAQNSMHDNVAMGLNVDNSDNNTIYDNIIYNHPNWGLRIWSATHATITGNEVYNNSFYNNQTGIVIEDEQTDLKIKNNALSTNNQTASAQEISLESGHTYSGLDIDYNLYYRPSGTTYWKYGATNYSFANWKTNSGQDTHSVNADPLFLSSSNFTLQSTSPAINAGTNVGLTSDYENNPVPNGLLPDIGAYEYQSSAIGEDQTEDNQEQDLNTHNVKATSTINFITITWKTDHNAKSTIRYGTSRSLKEKKKDNAKEKEHKATLTNLLPDTKYYFRIKAEDGDDNEDSSRIHSIKTQLAPINVSSNQNQDQKTNNNIGNATPSTCSYTVESGDTLWGIAKKVYGDATVYPMIIEKNKDKYPDIGSKLSIGQELRFCDNN